MAWANPNVPNLPDYILFVTDIMQISPLYLPADSPYLQWSLDRAQNLVLQTPCGGTEYTVAVYNCAGHILLVMATDQAGREFFEETRKKLGMLKFAAGVVASTSDQSTSTSLAVPDALKQLTIGDLDFMRSQYGRNYMSYSQDYGPTIWGLS